MKKLNGKLAVLALVAALAAARAPAGNPNPRVLPPGSAPNNLSYGAWSDAWWQWALSIPAADSPLNDPTGANAAIGQSGPVWFLAGTQGGDAERTVTVPAGKMVLFPLVTYVWVNTPQYGDPEWSPEQEAFARAYIASFIDTAYDLTCQIDGRQVTNLQAYRFQTPVGGAQMVTRPEGNIFGIAAGTYGPMVTDGYYLMVAPLPAGKHTLHFTGGLTASNFHLDVTYHITVR